MFKSIIFNLCILMLVVSCKETREDKIANYLLSKKIGGNTAIGILNPDYCGSCTDYSINWLCNKKTKGLKKVVLTTGILQEDYKNKLTGKGYTFVSADKNALTRAGITLTVCTYIEMEDDKITLIKSVK